MLGTVVLRAVFVSWLCSLLAATTLYTLLIMGNVERNPGPAAWGGHEKVSKPDLKRKRNVNTAWGNDNVPPTEHTSLLGNGQTDRGRCLYEYKSVWCFCLA